MGDMHTFGKAFSIYYVFIQSSDCKSYINNKDILIKIFKKKKRSQTGPTANDSH